MSWGASSSRDLLAIGDLHLPECAGWPTQRLLEATRARASSSAVTVLCGDLVGAGASRGDLIEALRWVDSQVAGIKLLVPGNHDVAALGPRGSFKRALSDSGTSTTLLLCGTAIRVPVPGGAGLVVAGATGAWPGQNGQGMVFAREARRLAGALSEARKLRQDGDHLIVGLHYPPTDQRGRPSRLHEIVCRHRPDVVCYAHVHRPARPPRALADRPGGPRWVCCAADQCGFAPVHVGSLT